MLLGMKASLEINFGIESLENILKDTVRMVVVGQILNSMWNHRYKQPYLEVKQGFQRKKIYNFSKQFI